MARTILLADDSVTIQKVVELTFLDEDFRVVAFGNGSDAVAALDEVRPDVVLADVHMPGADGYEVCAAARAASPAVPVLLLVGTFEIFDAQRAAEVGAAGHLKKPFDSQELLRQVQALADAAGSTPAASGETPPAIESALGAESAARQADPGASWSFEPVDEAPPAAEGEVAADTWAGVQPEELGAAGGAASGEPSDAPAWSAGAAEPGAGAAVAATAAAEAPALLRELSEADVDRIARRVVELIGDKAVRDVAWEVVPDLAELMLKARIEELEASVE
ncbi:MAG TPA: response regulator [Thermoanaerobaculia bacterium]